MVGLDDVVTRVGIPRCPSDSSEEALANAKMNAKELTKRPVLIPPATSVPQKSQNRFCSNRAPFFLPFFGYILFALLLFWKIRRRRRISVRRKAGSLLRPSWLPVRNEPKGADV